MGDAPSDDARTPDLTRGETSWRECWKASRSWISPGASPGRSPAMLLADHGARVTKIEPPGGDPIRSFSRRAGVAPRQAQRGPRPQRRRRPRRACSRSATDADIILESYSPGVTTRLGIDYDTLHALNPRLVYCSITGYGDDDAHSDRPGYDALGRRSHRPAVGEPRRRGRHHRAACRASEARCPDLAVPEDCWAARPRPGPLFAGVAVGEHGRRVPRDARRSAPRCGCASGPAAASGSRRRCSRACSRTTVGGVAEGRARRRAELPELGHRPARAEGRVRVRGRPVDAPLGAAARVRARRVGGRHARDHRRGHGTARRAACGSALEARGDRAPPPLQPDHGRARREVPGRRVDRARGRGRHAGAADALARGGAARRRCSSPTAASSRSTTPSSGPSARSAACSSCTAVPDDKPAPPVAPGANTDDVEAEADARRRRTRAATRHRAPRRSRRSKASGCSTSGSRSRGRGARMMLADLGADVIKVNTLYDGYWMSNHIAMACNRGKRSISHQPQGPARHGRSCAELVETRRRRAAQHALRRGRPPRRRLRVAASKINPTSSTATPAASSKSERELLPGNDQTGAALAGPDWLDGGLDNDGTPLWPVISLGDTGNGFLSAIAMIQALYHRDRTGEGQFVDTSIIYAQLLNASIGWVTPDGKHKGDRPQVDQMQLGWNALYRLYQCTDETGCASLRSTSRTGSRCARPSGATTSRPTRASRPPTRARTTTTRSTPSSKRCSRARPRPSGSASSTVPACPCEVSTPDFVLDLFNDPEMIEKGWVDGVPAPPRRRRWTSSGCSSTSSETPGVMQGPPLVPGQHTRRSCASSAYDDRRDRRSLREEKVVLDTSEQIG